MLSTLPPSAPPPALAARARPWPALALLLAFVATLAWDAAGLDLPLARLVAGPHGFPWRDAWALTTLLHEGGRRAGWALELGLCVGMWWPVPALQRLDGLQRLQLALTPLVALMAVWAFKELNATSCPWDLQQFGGVAHYVSHWAWRAGADGGTGHCFPAGHAAGGFAYLGGWFVFRRTDAVMARRWLLGALGAGLVLGLAQQLRGAHFMSHTLWSAWLCAAVAWGVDGAMRLLRPRLDPSSLSLPC